MNWQSSPVLGHKHPPRGRCAWLPGGLLVLSLSLHCAISHAKDDGGDAGRRLAEKVYHRPVGADISARETMVLIEKGYAPRERGMFVYRLKKAPGVVWSLIRFKSPPSIDGTGLLTKDKVGVESEQWVYLPALDRVRRISSSHKGGRFVGSDFYYEDLRDRPVSMDEHRIMGKGTIDGVACDVLESIPVNSDNSVYSKRISWIDPKTYIPLRVDFYEGGPQPSKRLLVRRIENIQGYDTVVASTMTDLRSGHKTRIITQVITYKQKLPDTLFSRRALSDPEFEARFRP